MALFKQELSKGLARNLSSALFPSGEGEFTQTQAGGTTRQFTDLSDEDVESLLTQKLSSIKGLADVSSGSRLPGLYDTTVQTQLTNDLLSKAAVEVAKARAPVVTEKAPTITKRDTKQQSMEDLLISTGIAVAGGIAGDLISESLEGILDFDFGGKDDEIGISIGTGGTTGDAGGRDAQFETTGRTAGTSFGRKCFITTAVCQLHGKPDDCQELRILRKFRDTFMQTEYPELVVQYYAEAPAIAKALENSAKGMGYLETFLTKYIKPAISSILRDNNDAAMELYAEMFTVAKDTAANLR